jgi:hypothetical protein
MRPQGMLVLDAFKGHLTLDVRSVFHAMTTDLVISEGLGTTTLSSEKVFPIQ